MKLATLHDGSRDGQLVVVSRDLASAHLASHVAGTLQQVLDDWNFLSPQLEDIYATLNGGKARHAFAFDAAACLAPLPRAHFWAPAGVLARCDGFLRPQVEAALRLNEADPAPVWRGQLAVITGDVAVGADDDTALDGVRFLLLAATLHAGPAELATAFGPVVATPDELGAAWRGGRCAQPLALQRDGVALPPQAQPEDAPGFGRCIAALARSRGLGAGSLVGGWAQEAGAGWAAGSSLVLSLEAAEAAGLDEGVLGAVRLRAVA